MCADFITYIVWHTIYCLYDAMSDIVQTHDLFLECVICDLCACYNYVILSYSDIQNVQNISAAVYL